MALPTTTAIALQARVRIEIRDGGQTFLDTEVTEAVQRAIDDEVVFTPQEITLLLTGARQYALDPSYSTIFEITCDSDGDGFPEVDMPGEAYNYIAPNLNIAPNWKNLSGTLFIWVAKKWVVSDNIPTYLSNYIINAAVASLGELLQNSYESRFLNNDVTMSELLNRGNAASRERDRLRKGLRNQKPTRL